MSLSSAQDVSIQTLDGVKLAGRLFLAQAIGPGVVMLPGFGCVKEMSLPEVAVAFVEAGVSSLIIDPRCTGASDGTPRQEINPQQQISDVLDAMVYMRQQPLVERSRTFVWGYSFGGIVGLNAAALDDRIAGVITIAPTTDFSFGGKRNSILRQAQRDRVSQLEGNDPCHLPILAEDGSSPAGFAKGLTKEDYRMIQMTQRTQPTWQNSTTLQTYYHIACWAPFELLPLVKQSVLLVTPEDDQLSLRQNQEAALSKVSGPKRQFLQPDKGHMDILGADKHFPRLIEVQVEFMTGIVAPSDE